MIKKILIATTLLAVTFVLKAGEVSYANDNVQAMFDTSSEPFFDLEEDDTITILPNGAFLHGEATLKDYETDEVLASYNSDLDPNSITVQEAQMYLRNSELIVPNSEYSIEPYASSPATQIWTLGAGASYSSSAFSGSGWRFAGYLFEKSKGGSLFWASYGSKGVIGSKQNALDTKSSGEAIGQAIASGGSTYYSGRSTFYAYNPKSGSTYYVANQ